MSDAPAASLRSQAARAGAHAPARAAAKPGSASNGQPKANWTADKDGEPISPTTFVLAPE